MINLEVRKARPGAREFKVGEVAHLKVVSIDELAPSKWRLTVDDVTPLPGAEPTAYACAFCGFVGAAKPDGSLPNGWIEERFEQGSHFVCDNEPCQVQRICRVCGCSGFYACETDEGPCYWIENDLCSACAAVEGNNVVEEIKSENTKRS